ncbi:hypothetical protein ACQ4M4_08855 [Leptolyngbya sp. AN02str]|uniref:hypothetical protein n=1 Tax=Leptolyngbya sp. AN02str TaxID=3423363 RepID=UPI003D32096B
MQSSVQWLKQRCSGTATKPGYGNGIEPLTSDVTSGIATTDMTDIAGFVESETESVLAQAVAIAFLVLTLSITLVLAVTVKPFFLLKNLRSKR